MNRFWKVCLFVGSLLPYSPIIAQETERPIIVLDPGHGGKDPGAIGVNGIREKDIVLEVGKEVIRLNKELYDNSLEIYLTRYADTLISLRHRTDLAKALKADVFISIHCNQAIGNKSARGIEVYMYPFKGNFDNKIHERSVAIATTMLNGFQGFLGYNVRGQKYANFQVLRDLSSICPAILLEIGFLSNSDEAAHASSRSAITGFAMVILQALKKKMDAGSF